MQINKADRAVLSIHKIQEFEVVQCWYFDKAEQWFLTGCPSVSVYAIGVLPLGCLGPAIVWY